MAPLLASVLALVVLVGCQPLTLAMPTDDACAGPTARRVEVGREPPNIVLVTTDDQADYDMRWMPRTRRLLGKTGVTFVDSLSPHPLCCPARAEILTGQFAQNNGVRTNWGRAGGFHALHSYRDTIGPWLQRAGYRTAFVGKFLNHYMSSSRRPRGWDAWYPLLHDRGLYRYYGFAALHNKVVRRHPRVYVTDFIAAQTNRLVRRFGEGRRPFFIWQSHVAPHLACAAGVCGLPPVPARRHAGLLTRVRPPSFADPAFLERDVTDKPKYMAALDTSRLQRRRLDALFTRRIQSLQAVDQAVARTIRALRSTGELRRTVVLFTSDNGYLLGEHRWSGKDVPYEQALQVPLLLRGPGFPKGVRRHQTVATVDLAPTFLELAGAHATVPLDGMSIVSLAESGGPGRGSILIQSGPRFGQGDDGRWFYRGVRTKRYTYAKYPRYRDELYDRRRDPHQLRNVAGRQAYRQVQRELQRRLAVFDSCAGALCRREFGPLPPAGERAEDVPSNGQTPRLSAWRAPRPRSTQADGPCASRTRTG